MKKPLLIGLAIIALYFSALFYFDHPAAATPTSLRTADPIVLTVALIVLYLLPSAVALVRGIKTPQGPILLDLLLGWTVLGWIAALIWAACAPVAHASSSANASS